MRLDRALLCFLALALGTAPLHAQTAKAESGPIAPEPSIEHDPLTKAPRGLPVVIACKVHNPSSLFAPQVYARATGTTRFQGYTLVERTKRPGVFLSRLPSSILNEGSFEYFIEARSGTGDAARAGSPSQPYTCSVYDPPPVPVASLIRTDVEGAAVSVDGDLIGKSPLKVKLAPGLHTISVTAPDGRGAEKQIDVRSGQKRLDLNIPLPEAGGPGSLAVTSDPSGANVLIDGALSGQTPYQGPVTPGDHVVAVEMDGRLRQERKVTARQGRDASLAFALAALPKDPALAIESEPAAALVAIDGKDRGRTPWVGPLTAGSHQVVLKKEGHREIGTDFNMPRDRDMSLRLELPKGSGSNIPRLTVSTDPVGATVNVDGKDVGLSPWSGEVRTGERKVAVKLDGFRSDERKVPIASGRDADVAFALAHAPGPGKLRIETEPPEAKVAIDGTDVGFSPFSGDVPPGDHHVEVSLEKYRGVAQDIALAAGQQLSLRLALQEAAREKVPPLIAVASDPQGAELLLDGKTVGATPVKARSTPGPHEIKLLLDGYTTRTGKINLPDGRDFELRMAISLRPVRGNAETHSAPDQLELARSQLKRAQACYKQGDWKCALDGYNGAYVYKPLPELLYNIAQTHRKMGHYAEAQTAYRNFAKETKSAKMKEEAERYIAVCEVALHPEKAQALASATAGAEPDGKAAAVSLETARAQLNRAQACYKTADWKCALEGYQAAYQYKRIPELLYNIAQTRRHLGQYEEAQVAYKNFARETTNARMKSEAAHYIVVCDDALHPERAQSAVASAAQPGAAQGAAGAPSGAATTGVAAGALAAALPLPGTSATAAAPAASDAALAIGDDALSPGKAGGKPSAANMFAADDDTDPPIIAHTKIEKAFRGQALRITARIADERSDVGTAQACWRNLFHTDYKCAPLIKVGEDEFGVEVPAKSVADGFAYYLEAYDTSENGPARAGAPELPNAVAIEDVPPPRPLSTDAGSIAEASAQQRDPAFLQQKEVPRPPEVKNHLLSYIAIGGAAAVVAAGVGLQLHANSSLNSITQGGKSRTEQDSIRSQASTEQTLSYVLFGASGAFALGAAAFWNTNF